MAHVAKKTAAASSPSPLLSSRKTKRSSLRMALLLAAGMLGLGGFMAWRHLPDWRDRHDGLELAQMGRFAEAAPLLRLVSDRHPNDVAVAKALALGYRNNNQLPEAEPYFERWCTLRPGDAEPFKERIDYWMRRSWVPQALADGRHVLNLETGNDGLRAKVAHWALMTAHYQEAERECQRCLEKWPSNPELLYLLSNSLHRQGRGAAAEPILDRLMQDHPQFAGPLVLRAILHVEAEQPEKAIPLLRQSLVLEENPQQMVARYFLSQALARTGQHEEAQRVLAEMQSRQALDLLRKEGYPDNPALQVRVAEALLAAGKPDEAVRLLQHILAQSPDCADAHRLLAAHSEKQGKTNLTVGQPSKD